MPDPSTLTPEPLTAAILSAGALLMAALRARKPKALPTSPACCCKDEILQAEDRVKKHMDAMQIQIKAQLEATHRHAGLIPEVKENVAILVAFSQRGDRR